MVSMCLTLEEAAKLLSKVIDYQFAFPLAHCIALAIPVPLPFHVNVIIRCSFAFYT
jgi:hypothetical protein